MKKNVPFYSVLYHLVFLFLPCTLGGFCPKYKKRKVVKDFKVAQPIIAPAWTNVMEKLSSSLIFAVHLELITEAVTQGVL